MQDLVGGDNNRTPVIFQVPDIYRFVEVSTISGQIPSPQYVVWVPKSLKAWIAI
ncbi:MAG: hypothetical protein JRE14_03340 [Deltaproteobacteria bacterium]|nr:hypothetical protein [Deltaproteobacteria bacterium]